MPAQQDVCSSSDELIDFDNELPSDVDVEDGGAGAVVDEDAILNRIYPRRQLAGEPTRFSALAALKRDDNPAQYKVVGYKDVAPTCKPTSVTASWVAGSTEFSAQITALDDLSRVDAVEGIAPKLVEALSRFTDVLFPVQMAVFPALIASSRSPFPPRDFVITAPTGSGKTLSFVIPILNALESVQHDASAVFALVIAPVQNLARQIHAEFTKYNVNGARIVLLNGTQNYDTERKALFPDDRLSCSSHVHVIVATPARLVEHLVDDRGVVNLSHLRFLVVDEADRLNDTARMEWLDVVERRARAPPTNNLTIAQLMRPDVNQFLQKILCSATLSLDLDQLHVWNLRCPRLFKAQSGGQSADMEVDTAEVANGDDNAIDTDEEEDERKPAEKMSEAVKEKAEKVNVQGLILPANLAQQVIMCQVSMKPAFLYLILATEKMWNRILIFVNQKKDARKLTRLLSTLARSNFTVAEFSSDKFASRREQCLKRFSEGKIRVLVSTDVLSRGIDVADVDCVINYHPPINERIFVHRAGRTARGLKAGTVISLVDKDEKMRVKRMLMAMGAWKPDMLSDRRKTEDFLKDTLLRKYNKTLEYLRSKKESEH